MTDIYISMELERIADHAAAIAKIVVKLGVVPDKQFIDSITGIAGKCQVMLKDVMQAYERADDQLARNIAILDDEVDTAEREFNEILFKEMCANAEQANTYTYLLWITHNLERIGDRITNIAERVVYLVTNVTPELNR
jgi:phosphate transport system protein